MTKVDNIYWGESAAKVEGGMPLGGHLPCAAQKFASCNKTTMHTTHQTQSLGYGSVLGTRP
eukprot:8140648-Pyramimonas_sp.AAC.1